MLQRAPSATLILIAVFVLAGCSTRTTTPTVTPTVVQTPTPTASIVKATPTAVITSTPLPTVTVVAPTPTPGAPTATPVPKAEAAPQIIKDASAAMDGLKSYRVRAWLSVAGPTYAHGPSPTPFTNGTPFMLAEVSGSDSQTVIGDVETIKTGDQSFERSGAQGQWSKIAPAKTQAGSSIGASFLHDLANATGTALELYDGTPCQVVSAEKPADTPGGTPTEYKVWIGVFDHLVRRYESVSKSGPSTVQSVIVFSDFNAPMTITAPSSAIPAPVVKVGERAVLDGMALTVTRFQDPFTPGSNVGQPAAGSRFVAVDVTIEDIGSQPITYNAFYFKMADSQSREYAVTFTSVPGQLNSGNLKPGEKVQGAILFQIPKGSTPTQLEENQGLVGGAEVTAKLGAN